MMLSQGMTNTEVLDDYPALTLEDIHAVLAYAAESDFDSAGTGAHLCLV